MLIDVCKTNEGFAPLLNQLKPKANKMKNTETIKENRERIEHLLVVRKALDMYLKFWEEGEVGTDFQSRVKNSIIKELQNIETKLDFLGYIKTLHD